MNTSKFFGISALIIAAGIVAACQNPCEQEADHIEAALQASSPINNKNIFSVSFSVRDRNDGALHCPVVISVKDDVITGAGPEFKCNKRGESEITFALGSNPEIQTALQITCQLIDRLDVPEELILKLGEPPRELEVLAFSGKEEVVDAVIRRESADPSVVKVEGSQLVPVAVGRTRVRSSVDDIQVYTKIVVGEKVLAERFNLPDGSSTRYQVMPGHHLIEVLANAERGGKSGVSLSWEGAFCLSQPEAQLHRFDCFVGNEAVLRLTNPDGFPGRPRWPPGVTVSGSIGVTRIP